MDSTLLFLKEEANKITKYQIDNFYLNSTNPIDIPIKSFLNLFDIIINSKDKDLILGFCYSIAPYISKNRSIIKSKYSHDIWTNLITFSEVITDPLQVFGFCEGALTTSFCCLTIDEAFLDFLIDEKPLQCKMLKPSLLITLYSDLPFDFIPLNSKKMIPMITDYFVESIPVHSILNLYLANLLDFTCEELKNFPNFEKNLWSSLYNVISDDSSRFASLSNPFIKFRRLNENFFSESCEFISTKIDEIEQGSFDDANMKKLVSLVFLLPFFSTEDVDKFMRKAIPVVSLYIAYKRRIPKELTRALNESKVLLAVYSVAMKLYSICTVFLDTEFYPAVIYFLSVFLSEFSSHYPQCYNAIITKFADGLDSTYPIKFPLAFAIYENSESILNETAENNDQSSCECNHHHHNHYNNNENEHEHVCECHHHQSENENDHVCECHHHNHKSESESVNENVCECHHHHDHNEIANDHVCECHHDKNESESVNDHACECHHEHENEDDDICECHDHDHSENDHVCVCNDHHHHVSGEINESCQCCSNEADECSENCECANKEASRIVVKDRVIPALLKISTSTSAADVHWAFKAMRSLLNEKSVDLFPSNASLFAAYSFKADSNFTNDSLLCYHHFYKYLYHYINAVKMNETQLKEAADFAISQIDFIQSNSGKFSNKNLNFFLIKTDFCNLLRLLFNIENSEVNKFSDFAMSIAKELFFSDYFKSFPSAIQLVSLLHKKDSKNEDEIRSFIERALKIGRDEVHSNETVQSEVVSQLPTFEIVTFSDISEIAKKFIERSSSELNFTALQLIEEYLKRVANDKSCFDLIASPFIEIVATKLKGSTSEKVVNKAFSVLTIFLDSFYTEKIIVDHCRDVIMATLLGRIRLFDHLTCYNYSFLQSDFKFFSFSSHFIVKFPKSQLAKNIVDDFSFWILRISSDVVPKLLKVLELAVALKIVDQEAVSVLSAAVISRISEDNWKLKIVDPSLTFLLKLKQKYPAKFPLNSLLICLEKVWEENQDDNPKITSFLIPVFLQVFADQSFNISGDFLVFHDISLIVAAESFDLNYPEIVKLYIQMYQNKIPFDSFDKCAAIVFTHFLSKNQSALFDSGFSIDMLKTMHTYLKQMFKNNKSTERYVDNYFADNPIVMDRIKYIKKSPQLPDF